jgi:hypothetical protein
MGVGVTIKVPFKLSEIIKELVRYMDNEPTLADEFRALAVRREEAKKLKAQREIQQFNTTGRDRDSTCREN